MLRTWRSSVSGSEGVPAAGKADGLLLVADLVGPVGELGVDGWEAISGISVGGH